MKLQLLIPITGTSLKVIGTTTVSPCLVFTSPISTFTLFFDVLPVGVGCTSVGVGYTLVVGETLLSISFTITLPLKN